MVTLMGHPDLKQTLSDTNTNFTIIDFHLEKSF